MLLYCLFLGLALLQQVSATKKTDELVEEAIADLKPSLRPIVGLDDLSKAWRWRHWLVLHQEANLTCRWGSVYPLEGLARAGHAVESSGSAGERLVTVPLSSPHLLYRFDNCVLQRGGDQHAEPLWGEVSNTVQLELGMVSSAEGCVVTVRSLVLSEPGISFNKDNSIVKALRSNDVAQEVSDSIRDQVVTHVNDQLKEVVGRRFTLSKQC